MSDTESVISERNEDEGVVNYDDESEEEEENEDEQGKKGDDDDDDDDAEVEVVTHKVVRQKVERVDGPTKGKTGKYMTKYEYARLLGLRATAIELGGVPCNTDTRYIDATDIAREEIELGLCPLNILRRLSPRIVEVWYRVQNVDGTFTMELPQT
jgi:DNA-directed RNA polymerase subunit K/omega